MVHYIYIYIYIYIHRYISSCKGLTSGFKSESFKQGPGRCHLPNAKTSPNLSQGPARRLMGSCKWGISPLMYLSLPNPTFLWVFIMNPNVEFKGPHKKGRVW